MKSKLGFRHGNKHGFSAEAFEVDNSVSHPLDAVFFRFFSLKEI